MLLAVGPFFYVAARAAMATLHGPAGALGAGALACFVVANVPFWLRMSNVIGTRGQGYPLTNRLFGAFFALALALSLAFMGGQVFGWTHGLATAVRWGVTALSLGVLLVADLGCWLALCVGINFVGQ